MNTLASHVDWKLFERKDGSGMLWLPRLMNLVAVDEEHTRALQSVLSGVAPLESLPEELLCAVQEDSAVEEEWHPTFKPTIDAFRVVMTEACNFRCPGCFSTTALRSLKSKLRSMSSSTATEVFSGILPYAAENPVLIHFFGGEPLLRFEQIRLGAEILTSAFKEGTIHRPTLAITTNGFLINDEIIQVFLDYGFEVGVSVEGDPALHDSIRRTAKGEATFDVVAERVDALIARGVDTHILFTPYLDDQHCMEENLQFLIERFPSPRITINTAFNEQTLAWETIDDYAELLVNCERVAQKYGVQIDSALTPVLSALATGEQRRSPQATTGGRVMVTVDPDGFVFRSSQKWSKNLLVGDLATARHAEFASTRSPACSGCEARYICGGPNEEFLLATNSHLDPAKCTFHKKVLHVLASNYEMFAE